MAEGTNTPSPEDTNHPIKAEEADAQVLGSISPLVTPNPYPVSNLPRVTPFPVPKESNAPILPKIKSVSAGDLRQASNPEFTLELLQEIQQIVTNWQQELQSLHLQIEQLYLEGPMIDGWLESRARQQTSDRPLTSFRHADIQELMAYIEELSQQDANASYGEQVSYQLCGLDEQGTLWSKPCPHEQIPSVSLAIARYQKVKQLLKRKQSIEQKVTQLAENLIVCCTNLQERG